MKRKARIRRRSLLARLMPRRNRRHGATPWRPRLDLHGFARGFAGGLRRMPALVGQGCARLMPPLGRLARAWAPYAAVALLTAAMPLAGAKVWLFFTQGNHFALREVEVQGNSRVSSREVLAFAGLRAGETALGIDPESVQEGVRKHPLLRDVTVEVELPGRLRIAVEEREPAALVALGALYYADERGVIYQRVRPGDNVDGLVVVTGLDASAYAGEEKAAEAERVVREALMVAAEYRAHPVGRVIPLDALHHDAAFGWRAVLAPYGPEVQLGWGHTATKLDRLVRVLADVHQRGERAAFIALDDDRDEGRVVVRLGRRPETAGAPGGRNGQRHQQDG